MSRLFYFSIACPTPFYFLLVFSAWRLEEADCAGSDCRAFWLFMDSNRRHLKRTMKLLIFVMGHLLNCFLQQSHNSIYVISFYFQQQLIMYSWLLVFISEVPWPFKFTSANLCLKGNRNVKQPVCIVFVFRFFYFSCCFQLIRSLKCLALFSVFPTCSFIIEVNMESFSNRWRYSGVL